MKEKISKDIEVKKENFWIGKHTYDYDRINSGNFTDYELSTMYDENIIKKYKGKDRKNFKIRI